MRLTILPSSLMVQYNSLEEERNGKWRLTIIAVRKTVHFSGGWRIGWTDSGEGENRILNSSREEEE